MLCFIKHGKYLSVGLFSSGVSISFTTCSKFVMAGPYHNYTSRRHQRLFKNLFWVANFCIIPPMTQNPKFKIIIIIIILKLFCCRCLVFLPKICPKKCTKLWKLKYFTLQKYNLQKILEKKNQNPSRYYYNSIITNLKCQHKIKYHLSKIII